MPNNDVNEQIVKVINFRHACKTFDADRKIPTENFDLILESARLSPSSFGFEPWRFVVLQNKEIREGLIPMCWGARRQLPTASHFILILSRRPSDTIYSSEYIKDMMQRIQKLDAAKLAEKTELYSNFQKFEFKLLESERALLDHAGKQCYIAMANMMYTAALLGIDSCAMEGFDLAAAESYLVKKGVYDPKIFGLTSMLSFGYRIQENFPKQRHELSEIVDWVE